LINTCATFTQKNEADSAGCMGRLLSVVGGWSLEEYKTRRKLHTNSLYHVTRYKYSELGRRKERQKKGERPKMFAFYVYCE
jgi:hypothetical protein